jgi:Tol biopolymer transport system component
MVPFFTLLVGMALPQTPEAEKSQGLPLEIAEVLEFEVDEGTWMSLDVSPAGGDSLVFDLLGDIYTLPIAGGEATRIVGEMSFESQPRFSPDGRTIAFLSDRSGVENLWLVDADGANPRAVTKDKETKSRPQLMASPSWTTDGDYLLVSRSRPPERTYGLFLYHRDGGAGARVGPPPPKDEPPGPGQPPIQPPNKLGAIASPDGRYIYYAERRGAFNYNAQFPIWQIVRFDRETSETATVTNAQGSALRPLLSPDGKSLVYASRFRTGTGLRVRDLETGAERWLHYPVTRDDQESRATRDTMPGYAFTPDGKSLVLSVGGKIHRIDFATGESRVVPFTAKVAAEIGPRVHFRGRVDDSGTVRARVIRWPSPSPDGTRLAFSAFNHVWIAPLPGGAPPRRLTKLETAEFMPTWSPDGRTVLFVTWSTEGGHIYRAAADGSGEPERLTDHPAFYADPVYSPDGSRIVFVAGSVSDQLYSFLQEDHVYRDDDGEIAGVSATGPLDLRHIPSSGGPSTLIASAGDGRYPHFAADPERVYLTSSSGLTSIRLDGFDRRTHFKIVGSGPAAPEPPGADAISLSPDGRRAFVNIQNKHYLVSVPRAGKEVVEIAIAPGGDPAFPVKPLSAEGGNYLGWSRDGSRVHWSSGRRFFRQTVAPELVEIPEIAEIDVSLTRPKPSGTVVFRGAPASHDEGRTRCSKAATVVTGNRIQAVGVKAGASARPSSTSRKDADAGSRGRALAHVAPRRVHQTEAAVPREPRLRRHHHRDPQTSTDDVFAYSDLVEADGSSAASLRHGPGFRRLGDPRRRDGVESSEAVPGSL